MTTQQTCLKGVGTILRRIVVGCCMFAMIAGTAPSAAAADILTGTGPQGSFSHFVGRAICRAINRSAVDTTCEVIPADSATHNLTNLNGGSLDLALLDSRLLVQAAAGSGRFAFLDIRYDNLGMLIPLYQLPILVVARADAGIATLADLPGKRINAGIALSAVREAIDLIMAAKRWTRGDFKLVQELPGTLSQANMAFCHGALDAMIHIGVHPDATLQQLIDLCDAVLVGMDDKDIAALVTSASGLSPVTIPTDAYTGMAAPVASIGTTIHLVASGSLDPQTVRTVLAALEANRSSLSTIHSALEQLTLQRPDQSGIGFDLHPGAEDYFSMQNQ